MADQTTNQTKHKFTYWLIGLFTGASVAAPITAFITKKICDKKAEATIPVQPPVNPQTTEAKSDAIYAEKDPSVTEDIPDAETINNWDLDIDDKEATEEAHDRTEAHERYLDMVGNYTGDEVLLPRIISEDDFVEEQYMQKAYVNWYAFDNVFEENLSVIEDPYATFGVANGSELFRDDINRRDPNIIYIRNEKLNTDFEITRIFGSYQVMVGGEGSLGETDT